ncbi:23254_t:CDS:2, partial [Gigaspora rosea]
RQVLESSNKENSQLVSHTYRSSGSSINNEANYYQLSASTTKFGTNTRRSSIPRGPSQERFNKHHLEKESQADKLKEILGRLTAIEKKYKINSSELSNPPHASRIEFKIATHNINGLKANNRKMDAILEWAEQKSLNILGITETNIT